LQEIVNIYCSPGGHDDKTSNYRYKHLLLLYQVYLLLNNHKLNISFSKGVQHFGLSVQIHLYLLHKRVVLLQLLGEQTLQQEPSIRWPAELTREIIQNRKEWIAPHLGVSRSAGHNVFSDVISHHLVSQLGVKISALNFDFIDLSKELLNSSFYSQLLVS